MKAKLFKSILCFGLAGALFFGEASVALAADTGGAKKSADTAVVTEEKERNSEEEARLDYVNIHFDGDYFYYEVAAYAARIDIYLNDELIESIDNLQTESVYDEDGNYAGESYDPAPYKYMYSPIHAHFQAGATYKITAVAHKISPDGSAFTEGATMSSEGMKAQFARIDDVEVYSTSIMNIDDDGLSTGFEVYDGIQVYIDLSSDSYLETTLEIQRKTGSKGTWKTIANVSGIYSAYCMDTTAKPGSTYYYRVRPTTVKDTYVSKVTTGSWVSADSVKAGTPVTDVELYYGDKGVVINLYDPVLVSGCDIYRSTKKSSGYKKIATISSGTYTDNSVKSGTYYYKVKPYYYHLDTKKKVYGDYTDPMGVKILMSAFNFVEVKQTGTTKAKLTWEKVKGASVYEIYAKTNVAGDAYKYIGSTKKSYYDLSNLSSDGEYTFKIRATQKQNDIKSYYQSTTAYLKMGFHQPYGFGVKKRTVTTTDTKMTVKSTLTWRRVYGAEKYRIEAYNAQKGEWTVVKTITKPTTTTYTITNTKTLDGYWKYSEVKIYAVDGKEESASWLNNSISSIDIVENVKVKRNNSYSAKISWDATKGADYYQVYRYAGTNREMYYVGGTEKTSFIDSKITPGVEYTYYVTSMNTKFDAFGAYTMSDYEDATNMAAYTHKMAKPSISSIKNSSSKKATLTWKSTRYATEYVIYRSTSKTGTYKKVGETSNLTFTDSGLTKGKTYYYKIVAKAVNDAGIEVSSEKSVAKSIKITK